ncbi:hypothetical protein K435DRAFT_581117, partial [Dendrothele bispora CBS 962.96]
RLHEQLQAQEDNWKKKGMGRLMGDSMLRLLTSVGFVNHVEEYTRACEEKEQAAKNKKVMREAVADMKVEWKRLNQERVKENEKQKEAWKEAVKVWKGNKA